MKLIALLGLAILPAVSFAGEFDQNNDISLLFGGYNNSTKISLDQKDDVGKGGGALGLRYIHNITPRLGIGGQMTLMGTGENESVKLLTNYITTAKLGTADFLGVMRARYGEERFRPYLLWGV